jgi:hypothetical protein
MAKILQTKVETTFEALCDGFPSEFVDYFQKVTALHFLDAPDYAELRQMFRELFIREGYVYDYCYDWSDRPTRVPTRPPQKMMMALPPPTKSATQPPSTVPSPRKSADMQPTVPIVPRPLLAERKPQRPKERVDRLVVAPSIPQQVSHLAVPRPVFRTALPSPRGGKKRRQIPLGRRVPGLPSLGEARKRSGLY